MAMKRPLHRFYLSIWWWLGIGRLVYGPWGRMLHFLKMGSSNQLKIRFPHSFFAASGSRFGQEQTDEKFFKFN